MVLRDHNVAQNRMKRSKKSANYCFSTDQGPLFIVPAICSLQQRADVIDLFKIFQKYTCRETRCGICLADRSAEAIVENLVIAYTDPVGMRGTS